jgi:hypothetical protein
MSSSCVSSEKSFRADDTAADGRLGPVVLRVVAALSGNGVARRLPGASGARATKRAGGFDEDELVVNSARSLLQTGQLVVLIGLHVSHCPQTMPISCCSSPNVIPTSNICGFGSPSAPVASNAKRQPVLVGLDEMGQATCETRSYTDPKVM